MSLQILNRPYQEDCLDAVAAAVQEGIRRPLIACATGTGKAVMLSQVKKRLGLPGKVMVLAHREELLEQLKRTMEWVNPDLRTEIEQAERVAPDTADVVVASVATLGQAPVEGRKRRLERFDPKEFDLVIVDECFPAGTPVDGRPIETIGVGQLVWSQGILGRELQPVVRTFRSRPSALVNVHLLDGTTIVCTPGHPFYDWRLGWVPAAQLTADNILVTFGGWTDEAAGVRRVWNPVYAAQLEQPDDSLLLGRMQGSAAGGAAQGCDHELRSVRSGCSLSWQEWFSGSAQGSRLLQRPVPRPMGQREQVRSHGRHEPPPLLGSHEAEQPHAQRSVGDKDAVHVAADRSRSQGARRQWEAATNPSTASPRRPGIRLGAGMVSADPHGTRQRLPALLQDRHRQPQAENRDRGGRAVPHQPGSAIAGCPEDRFPGVVGVDRVEVLEPGRDGTFGGLCPDGYVYNIEVRDNHNYFARGVLVHNCHHATATSYKRVFDYFGTGKPDGPVLLGCTATPERTDGIGLEAVFDRVVFEFGMRQGMEADPRDPNSPYLSPLRAWRIDTREDLSRIKMRGGDFAEEELAKAVNTSYRNTLALRAYQDKALGKSAVAFCANVQHAKDLADLFRKGGVPTAHVDGEMPTEERKRTLREFKDGTIKVLANCAILTEGWDWPRLQCLIMARPTKSTLLYQQMLGRLTRICDLCNRAGCEHKPHGIVLDLSDVTKHYLPSTASLLGLPPRWDCQGKDVLEQVKEAEQIATVAPMAIEEGLSMERARSLMREKRLLAPPPDRELLKQQSRLCWAQMPDRTFVLSVDFKEKLKLRIRMDVMGKFHVVRHDAVGAVELGVFGDRAEALQCADRWVRTEKPKRVYYLDRNSPWRRNPASDKQKALLQKIKLWRDGLTAGQAQELMDAFFESRRKEPKSAAPVAAKTTLAIPTRPEPPRPSYRVEAQQHKLVIQRPPPTRVVLRGDVRREQWLI